MSASFLKCSCAQCGGHIEFPADGLGLTIPCPHCAQPTELALALPDSTSARPGRSLKWIVAGVVILIVGVAGVAGALFMAKRLAKKSRGAESESVVFAQTAKGRGTVTDSTSTPVPARKARSAQVFDGFTVSEIKIQTSAASTLIYAVGTIKNDTDKPRYGVTVELGLYDATNTRLGSARDYKDTIEPHGEWTFRALLTQKTVASARLSSVREQP